MRILIFLSISTLPLALTSEPIITECAAALLELSSALSPCSNLLSNPTIRAYPNSPKLWVVKHALTSRSPKPHPDNPNLVIIHPNPYSEFWEYNALIAVGASRLYAENHDTRAFIEAVSDLEKIDAWTETIAGELGLSSSNPLKLDADKLATALAGIQFNAQWISKLSDTPTPEQTVFLIADEPEKPSKNTDWAVVARIAPNCSIIIHSETTDEAPVSLTDRIRKVLGQ